MKTKKKTLFLDIMVWQRDLLAKFISSCIPLYKKQYESERDEVD